MRRRLRIAVEVMAVLLFVAGAVFYGRTFYRDDFFRFNWIKDAPPSSIARCGRLYSCDGGFALTYQYGVTVERADPYRMLSHESGKAGGIALHRSPREFRYGTGVPDFVLGHAVDQARTISASVPHWALPAFLGLLLMMAMLPRTIAWFRGRRLRSPGFPVGGIQGDDSTQLAEG